MEKPISTPFDGHEQLKRPRQRVPWEIWALIFELLDTVALKNAYLAFASAGLSIDGVAPFSRMLILRDGVRAVQGIIRPSINKLLVFSSAYDDLDNGSAITLGNPAGPFDSREDFQEVIHVSLQSIAKNYDEIEILVCVDNASYSGSENSDRVKINIFLHNLCSNVYQAIEQFLEATDDKSKPASSTKLNKVIYCLSKEFILPKALLPHLVIKERECPSFRYNQLTMMWERIQRPNPEIYYKYKKWECSATLSKVIAFEKELRSEGDVRRRRPRPQYPYYSPPYERLRLPDYF